MGKSEEQWYCQALGDRVFDKDFDRVFDSLIVALSSMGMQVTNMERQSGYIAANGNFLLPERYAKLCNSIFDQAR